jgi:hypothetical protein
MRHPQLDPDVLGAIRRQLHVQAAPPERPPLGYRGYVVERPDGTRYVGVPGAVRRGDERRADRDGEFERLVLESQPR